MRCVTIEPGTALIIPRLIMQCYPEAEGGGTALSWPINSARVYTIVASGFANVTSHVLFIPLSWRS